MPHDSPRESVDNLFDAIAHGSEEHRAWLKEALTEHFAGRPVPEVRGLVGSSAATPAHGDKWRHFKGDLYEVVGTGLDHDGHRVVVYRLAQTADADPMFDHLHTRKLWEFLGSTTEHQPRFELVSRIALAAAKPKAS